MKNEKKTKKTPSYESQFQILHFQRLLHINGIIGDIKKNPNNSLNSTSLSTRLTRKIFTCPRGDTRGVRTGLLAGILFAYNLVF